MQIKFIQHSGSIFKGRVNYCYDRDTREVLFIGVNDPVFAVSEEFEAIIRRIADKESVSIDRCSWYYIRFPQKRTKIDQVLVSVPLGKLQIEDEIDIEPSMFDDDLIELFRNAQSAP